MDKNPANTDEALDYVKRVMHNCKALFGARTKTIWNVTFTEDDEGVEELNRETGHTCTMG